MGLWLGPAYRSRTNLITKVLDFVQFGGLAFTVDTAEPFSGIPWAFFAGIKLSSGTGTV